MSACADGLSPFTSVSTAVFRPEKLKSRLPLASIGRGKV